MDLTLVMVLRGKITSMTGPGNPYRHHTHRLDLEDPTIREWDATVLLADPDQGIVLDRSAFYPGGGGQPPDRRAAVGKCPNANCRHAQG